MRDHHLSSQNNTQYVAEISLISYFNNSFHMEQGYFQKKRAKPQNDVFLAGTAMLEWSTSIYFVCKRKIY